MRRPRPRCAATSPVPRRPARGRDPARWWPILHGVILRVRPAKSARKYASIWMPGSPLLVWSESQAEAAAGLPRRARPRGAGAARDALRQPFGGQRAGRAQGRGRHAHPAAAAVPAVLRAPPPRAPGMPVVRAQPSNCASSTATTTTRPTSRRSPSACWRIGRRTAAAKKLVLSFHGVPERTRCSAIRTTTGAWRAREACSASAYHCATSSSSSPSRAASARPPGCSPHTEPTLVALAKQGVASLDVMCPGFTADCLETLGRSTRRCACLPRGRRPRVPLHPCLNDSHPGSMRWRIALRHLQGWPTAR